MPPPSRASRHTQLTLGMLFVFVICMPGRSIALQMDANDYNDMGIVQQEKGDVDGAIENYRQAIKLKPDFPEAMYNLGVALQAKEIGRAHV